MMMTPCALSAACDSMRDRQPGADFVVEPLIGAPVAYEQNPGKLQRQLA